MWTKCAAVALPAKLEQLVRRHRQKGHTGTLVVKLVTASVVANIGEALVASSLCCSRSSSKCKFQSLLTPAPIRRMSRRRYFKDTASKPVLTWVGGPLSPPKLAPIDRKLPAKQHLYYEVSGKCTLLVKCVFFKPDPINSGL